MFVFMCVVIFLSFGVLRAVPLQATGRLTPARMVWCFLFGALLIIVPAVAVVLCSVMERMLEACEALERKLL